MNTLYNLADIEELIEFDTDCATAASNCPQVPYNNHELEIRRGELTAVEVFDIWNDEENVVWDSGYHEDLSDKTINTFDYVYENGRKGLWKLCGI